MLKVLSKTLLATSKILDLVFEMNINEFKIKLWLFLSSLLFMYLVIRQKKHRMVDIPEGHLNKLNIVILLPCNLLLKV